MGWLKFAIVAVCTVIIQTALVPVVFPEVLRPNVMIVAAAFYLLTSARDEGLVAAVVLGALADMTSISPLGSQIVAFAVFAAVIHLAKPIMFTDQPAAHAVAAFTGYIILVLVYRIVCMVNDDAVSTHVGAIDVLIQAAATGILAAIVCRILVRRTTPPENIQTQS